MAILRQSRLCRNLEEKELLNLMEQEGTVRTYSRGERIFQETDRPDSVYMLLNGSVIIAKETFSGKRILLAQLEDPGALFGEVYAFMEKASYDMYVEALTQVSVLIMSSRIFTDREENSLSRKLRENLLEGRSHLNSATHHHDIDVIGRALQEEVAHISTYYIAFHRQRIRRL